jgi:hypothetical protein
MKPPLVAVLCLAAAGAAFAAGWSMSGARSDGGSPEDSVESARLAREVEDLQRQLGEERARRPRAESARARSREETPTESAAPIGAAAAEAPSPDAAPGGEVAAFSLEGVTDAADASKKFMSFVEAQLKRGEPGFAAILQALDGLFKEKEKMQALFSDEAAASRQLYPWVKLLVNHDAQVIDLTEYVFKSMAENPAAFADMSEPKQLEIFTEGLGFLMPGAVPDERLARMRGYAEKILATPESEQSKAIRGNRSDIERLLARFWATPITPEEALEKLKAGDVAPRDLVKYLRMVPREAAAMLDVTALVLPHVRQGSYEVIRWLGSPPFDRVDFSRVDHAMIESLEAGKSDVSQFATYSRSSGRKQWTELRPLFDRALGGGERSVTTALQVLASGMLPSNLRPDKPYVESLLTRTDVSEATRNQLRTQYGLSEKSH